MQFLNFPITDTVIEIMYTFEKYDLKLKNAHIFVTYTFCPNPNTLHQAQNETQPALLLTTLYSNMNNIFILFSFPLSNFFYVMQRYLIICFIRKTKLYILVY